MRYVVSLFWRKTRTLTAMSWRQRRRRLVGLVRGAGKLPFYPVYYPIGWVLARLGVRVFSNRQLLPYIGHLAQEPDFFIKAGKAGLQPPYKGVILVPPGGQVGNRALLGYWSRHPRLHIFTNPLVALLMWPLTWMNSVNYYALKIRVEDGRLLAGWPANSHMLERYQRVCGDAPILTMMPADIERGRAVLDSLGVPADAWWACLHVRHNASNQDPIKDDSTMRDADLAMYQAAVRAIVDRGGWVFRLGNPGMPPLPDIARALDYANSVIRADWMDLYLIGGARFFLGCDSGPMVVASTFGTPVVAANYVPMGHGLLLASDIYIPKLYRSLRSGELLTFTEILGSNKRDLTSEAAFKSEGLEWVDNTSEEILAVTEEMMDRLDGELVYSSEDAERQEIYKTHFRSNATGYTFGDLSRVGRSFLSKYEGML